MKKILSVLVLSVVLLIITACPNAPAPEIITFSFKDADNTTLSSDAAGIISGTDIEVTVLYGVDVTNLIATFTSTGDSVTVDGTEQESGITSNDFTNPVTYRVTALDNSTQDYTVTVTVSIAIAGERATHTANTVNFNMNFVPGGHTFVMGEDIDDDESGYVDSDEIQTVTLTKGYWMGETEVTQGLWEDVWGTDWPGTDPENSTYGSGLNYPAFYLNWFDTVAFCNELTLSDGSIDNGEAVYYSDEGLTTAYTKADAALSADVYVDWDRTGFRLPTEAEWECAARWIDGSSWNGGDHASGDTTSYCWPPDAGTSTVIGDYAWYSGIPFLYNSQVVGTAGNNGGAALSGNANALGLFDMSGNVFEWCYDYWDYRYLEDSIADPTGPASGDYHVGRGGYWNYNAALLPCAKRSYYDPTYRYLYFGFRLCRTAD